MNVFSFVEGSNNTKVLFEFKPKSDCCSYNRFELIDQEHKIGLILHTIPSSKIFRLHQEGSILQIFCLLQNQFIILSLQETFSNQIKEILPTLYSQVYGSYFETNWTRLQETRHTVVIINPFSGTKQAELLFEKYAKPIFEASFMELKIILTTHAGHATQIAKELDISKWREIICIGGDGILNEVLQGVMSRRDWAYASALVKLGILPAGTGNAIASSLGLFDIPTAAVSIARGFFSPIDAFSLFHQNKRFYGLLSISYGSVSDADHGLENLRFLGGLRNLLGAIKVMLEYKTYKGKLRFLKTKKQPKNKETPFLKEVWQEKLANLNVRNLTDEKEQEVIAQEREQELKDSDGVQCPLLDKYFSNEGQKIEDKDEGLIMEEMEDEIYLLTTLNCSHITQDLITAPVASLNSGSLDLVMIRYSHAPVSRPTLIHFFAKMHQGKHVDMDWVDYIRIKALEFTPHEKGSYVSLDGEPLQGDGFKIEVHPSLLRLFVPQAS